MSEKPEKKLVRHTALVGGGVGTMVLREPNYNLRAFAVICFWWPNHEVKGEPINANELLLEYYRGRSRRG